MAICVATLRVHNCCWGLGHRCAVRVCAILALRWTHLSIYGCSISRLAMVLYHTASLVRLRACRCADSRLLFGHSTVRYILNALDMTYVLRQTSETRPLCSTWAAGARGDCGLTR